MKSHTQAKRKWQINNCAMTASFIMGSQSGVDTNIAVLFDTCTNGLQSAAVLCFPGRKKKIYISKIQNNLEKIIIRNRVTCWMWGSSELLRSISRNPPFTRNYSLVQMSDKSRITARFQQWLTLYASPNPLLHINQPTQRHTHNPHVSL